MNEKNPCLHCDCYDYDYESCTMPSCDIIYACPLHKDEPILKKPRENTNDKEM